MPESDPRDIEEVESRHPDARSGLAEEEEQSLADARQRSDIADRDQDREQRKAYARRLYWLVVVWLVVVGAILIVQGFAYLDFKLPVEGLTTLIGSTTISVIGLFAIVANYLFPRR